MAGGDNAVTTRAHAAAVPDRAAPPSEPSLAHKIAVALRSGDVVVAHDTLIDLWNEARQHHREANFHKRRARHRMQEFDRFRTQLEALGVNVVIETPDSHPSPRRTSDHHEQDPA